MDIKHRINKAIANTQLSDPNRKLLQEISNIIDHAATFRQWWHNIGSGIVPLAGADMESHAHRVSREAAAAVTVAHSAWVNDIIELCREWHAPDCAFSDPFARYIELKTRAEQLGLLPAREHPGFPRSESIRCPACGRVQEAQVHFEHWMPFPAYVHDCECGYTIMESDWEKVDPATEVSQIDSALLCINTAGKDCDSARIAWEDSNWADALQWIGFAIQQLESAKAKISVHTAEKGQVPS